jgi:hypothetical protein
MENAVTFAFGNFLYIISVVAFSAGSTFRSRFWTNCKLSVHFACVRLSHVEKHNYFFRYSFVLAPIVVGALFIDSFLSINDSIVGDRRQYSVRFQRAAVGTCCNIFALFPW